LLFLLQKPIIKQKNLSKDQLKSELRNRNGFTYENVYFAVKELMPSVLNKDIEQVTDFYQFSAFKQVRDAFAKKLATG